VVKRQVVKRHLGYELSKGEQKAGWDVAELRTVKLDYAARAAATLELALVLQQKLIDADLRRVMDLDMAALVPTIWMAHNGAPVDVERWQQTIPAIDVTLQALNEAADLDPLEPKLWNTAPRIRELLAERGLELPDTTSDTLKQYVEADPVIPLLLAYRGEAKGTSTYGQPMLNHWLSDEGRLHPSWMVLGTDTGRMSCTTVPFHGIPRESAYRSAIRAPAGRLIIKADYSQLQVRITAALAQDDAMLRLYHEAGDVHKATMAAILGKPISEVTDAERQLGKAIVFGLLFGSKVAGLRATLNSAAFERNDFTLVEVSKMRKTFFEKWPGLRWRGWLRQARNSLPRILQRPVAWRVPSLTKCALRTPIW
jgi:DNA polymerase-1